MIAIDGRFINKNISGIGRYILGLLQGIASLDTPRKVMVLTNELTFIPQSIVEASCFDFITLKYRVKSLTNQIRLPKLLTRYGVRVYHTPDAFAPILFSSGKNIITIHDLIPFRCRRILRKSKKVLLFPLWSKWLYMQCKKASAIVTVSNYSQNDLVELLKIPNEKIHVIYNGVKELEKKSSAKNYINEKYGFSGHAILYVGRFDPYKNVTTLIDAFNIIKEKISANLLIVGKLDHRYATAITSVKKLGLEKKVVFAHYVSDYELASIYAGSSVFVFPSLYEGFGLPPLEAMAYGIPVVSSNRSCLPEVLSDAALLVDPTPAMLASAIHKVLTDCKLRNDLIAKGYERVKQFSWRACAEKHLRLYESLLRK